jgi:2-dehydro-3-deoxygluconokinase
MTQGGGAATAGIASIGECMIELSAEPDGRWRMGFAGDTFNALWTMRALLGPSVPHDYVSAFGDDPFSARQIAFLAEAGIGVAASPRLPGARPGLYAITLDGHERSFTYWRSDSAARRLAEDPAALAASLAGRRLLLFSGITLAILDAAARRTLIEALAAARRQGARVAFDPNYRPRLWPESEAARHAIGQALAVCDIALPTFPDEAGLFGDADRQATVRRLTAAGVGEIVVKDGPDPALLAVGGKTVEIAALPSSKPLDTTGAGDAFNGAYLASRLSGRTPEEAVRTAHRVAARVVETRGALAPPAEIAAAAGDAGIKRL